MPATTSLQYIVTTKDGTETWPTFALAWAYVKDMAPGTYEMTFGQP